MALLSIDFLNEQPDENVLSSPEQHSIQKTTFGPIRLVQTVQSQLRMYVRFAQFLAKFLLESHSTSFLLLRWTLRTPHADQFLSVKARNSLLRPFEPF